MLSVLQVLEEELISKHMKTIVEVSAGLCIHQHHSVPFTIKLGRVYSIPLFSVVVLVGFEDNR